MNQIYLKRFTKEDNSSEYLDLAWRDITPNNIDNEIKQSMIRNEIENKTFQISLLQKVNPEYAKRFSDFNFYDKNKYDPKQEKLLLKKHFIVIDETDKLRGLHSTKIFN